MTPYDKGMRVRAPEQPSYWNHQTLNRRTRLRLAKRYYQAGRMSRETYRYLTSY